MSVFNILQQSPLDQCSSNLMESAGSKERKWVPSRYNVRAEDESGQLILWNTLSGSMSVFKKGQVTEVKNLVKKSGVTGSAEAGGALGYLVNRGFLIEENVNEYRKFQMLFGREHFRSDVLELILLASEDCNFRCKYCYEKFERGTMEPRVREAIKKLLARKARGLSRLNISWFGGEPLYGMPAIEDLAPFFMEYAQANDIGYASQMTTNGYLLTPDVADKLLTWGVSHFQITVDGTPEFHDCNRPTRDGQGTFAKIFSNLVELAKVDRQFSVAMRVNFDKKNAPHLDKFIDMVEEKFGGDNRFKLRFHAVGRWGGENDQELDICGDDSEKVMKHLIEEAEKRGLDVRGSLKGINSIGSQVCYAARPYNYIIGASGKLMKCTIALDTEDYNVVGELTDEGDLKLDDARMSIWTEPAFESDNKCQKCTVLPMCQGLHCPLVRIEQERSPCTSVRMTMKKDLGRLLSDQSLPRRTVQVSAS